MFELINLHYILLHFPIGLFVIGYFFNAIDYFKKNEFCKKYGDINILLGIISGVLAIISGFINDILGSHGHMQKPFLNHLLYFWTTHGTHMIISIILFSILLMLKYYKKCPKYIFYIHTICLIFFINGAHLGAELTGK